MAVISAALLPLLVFLATSSALPHKRGDSCLPTSYINPSFGQAKANVYTQAKKSVTTLTGRSDYPGGWVGENANTVVAQWDGQQGTRDYYDFIVGREDNWSNNPGGCHDYWQSPGVNCYNDDGMWAGLASVQEYEAYGDQSFLDRAVSIWTYMRYHGYVDQDVIDTGYLKGVKYENNTVSATCADQSGVQQSMIGGVYWQNGAPASSASEDQSVANNGYINSIATGLYANLGAQLCRVTKNDTYCDYAYKSAQWLDRFTLTSDGLVIDGVTGPTCELSAPNSLYSYNAGEYLAAYATLGGIKSDSDAIAKAESVIKASLSTTVWNDDRGILKEGAGDVTKSEDGVEFKAILIRDLHRAYETITDEQLKSDIVRYINIQYYALTQLDSDSQSQPVNYGRNWTGGYEVSIGPAQATAIDVLNGLILNPDSAYPSTTDTSVPISSI